MTPNSGLYVRPSLQNHSSLAIPCCVAERLLVVTVSILSGGMSLALGKALGVGGADDKRMANMTMAEQMEEMFFLHDIRDEAEETAIKKAAGKFSCDATAWLLLVSEAALWTWLAFEL